MVVVRTLFLVAFCLSLTGAIVMAQDGTVNVREGSWGGTGVEFVVKKDAVAIEYDCAVGEIRGRLRTDRRGNFTITGVHKRLYPGAIRVNLMPKAQPARYQGKITGATLRYKVTLIETGEVIGEYTVERGKSAPIRRCR